MAEVPSGIAEILYNFPALNGIITRRMFSIFGEWEHPTGMTSV